MSWLALTFVAVIAFVSLIEVAISSKRAQANILRRSEYFCARPILDSSEWYNTHWSETAPYKDVNCICAALAERIGCATTQLLPGDSFEDELALKCRGAVFGLISVDDPMDEFTECDLVRIMRERVGVLDCSELRTLGQLVAKCAELPKVS